jgi:hypothetical protein
MGELAEAGGDYGTAREQYYRAHRQILERAQGLAPPEGLQRFIFDRRKATQRLVEMMLSQLEDPEMAMRFARESAGADIHMLYQRQGIAEARSQTLVASHDYLSWRDEVEQELIAQWNDPTEELERRVASAEREARIYLDSLLIDTVDVERSPLKEPGPGELFLLYFPIDQGRVIGFGATSEGVIATAIDRDGLPDIGAGSYSGTQLSLLSARLLSPFEQAIARAERILILPSFGLQALPFHAFPWHGRPLIFHSAVEYSLDLPTKEVERNTSRSALVIGDPAGDLDGARREAESVDARLRSLGVTTSSLVGRAVTGPAVRAGLSSVGYLHYAGHSATSGELGWQSALHLAQGTSLTVADILFLEHVPRNVTLLSCSAGVARPDPREQGITLAGAFLVAGSEAVIALTADIDSTEADAVATAIYEKPMVNTVFTDSYRDGMKRLHKGMVAPSTWQVIRLWVP